MSYVGSAFAGTESVGGASVYIVTVAGQTYLKIDSALLSRAGIPATDCPKICGKYALLTADEAKPAVDALRLTALDRQFDKGLAAMETSGLLFKPASYDGQAVLKLSLNGTAFFVAASGPAYPLGYFVPGVVSFTFSEWNSVPPIKAPAASQVIGPAELEQLQKLRLVPE